MAERETRRIGLRMRPGRGCEAILLLREGAYAIPALDRPSDTMLAGPLDVYVHSVAAGTQYPAGGGVDPRVDISGGGLEQAGVGAGSNS